MTRLEREARLRGVTVDRLRQDAQDRFESTIVLFRIDNAHDNVQIRRG